MNNPIVLKYQLWCVVKNFVLKIDYLQDPGFIVTVTWEWNMLCNKDVIQELKSLDYFTCLTFIKCKYLQSVELNLETRFTVGTPSLLYICLYCIKTSQSWSAIQYIIQPALIMLIVFFRIMLKLIVKHCHHTKLCMYICTSWDYHGISLTFTLVMIFFNYQIIIV